MPTPIKLEGGRAKNTEVNGILYSLPTGLKYIAANATTTLSIVKMTPEIVTRTNNPGCLAASAILPSPIVPVSNAIALISLFLLITITASNTT